MQQEIDLTKPGMYEPVQCAVDSDRNMVEAIHKVTITASVDWSEIGQSFPITPTPSTPPPDPDKKPDVKPEPQPDKKPDTQAKPKPGYGPALSQNQESLQRSCPWQKIAPECVEFEVTPKS